MRALYERIQALAADAESAARPALLSPGRSPLRYAALDAQCRYVARALAGAGVQAGDRVAVVLPNGPEMAACFLGVASVAACAPLNPAYTERELAFYFEDLAPAALIVDPALSPAARAVAAARGVPVLELAGDPAGPAGRFTLSGGALGDRALPAASARDVALVLHTSGTTSRPKMVPLSQANLSASARNIAHTLQLGAGDRCLNIMPLFHIHGLVGVLLSSLYAGASVVCSAGFDVGQLFSWLAAEQPTWISAVPTMYEAMASQAGRQRALARSAPLRFLRSSSASLPPSLMATLEDVFGVPVIEAYGMTEASHQMASNPLPPRARKAGSVGVAAGPEIAVMHPEHGALLAPGETGEIVIRGANVTAGYVRNPAANAAAFVEGWFRTGDQGHLDREGYLFISGRLKEQINRGGEKISPREIDEAILSLPEVRQALAFALPHKTLGEDVGAVVVLRAGARLTEEAIRVRLAAQLAPFKVPARVLFLDEIPKGPTGKLQRIGLAARLAPLLEEAYVAPADELQRRLAQIWAEVLARSHVGARSNFFALGGDSLSALALSARAAERGLMVPIDVLFREPTIERLAPHVRALDDFCEARDDEPGPLALHGFQRVVLFPGVATPESFSSPSELVFALAGAVDRAALQRAVEALGRHHDAFRLRFAAGDEAFRQTLVAALDPAVLARAIHACAPDAFVGEVAALHRRFALDQPPLFRFVFTHGAPSKLAIVAHHLVADALSMRVVGEDFARAYAQALRGEPVSLPPVPTPAAAFMRRYERAAQAGRFDADLAAWLEIVGEEDEEGAVPDWTRDASIASLRHRPLDIGPISARLLAHARAHDVPPRDVLLAASTEAAAEALGRAELRVLLMHSGRELPLFGDLSRTVAPLVNLLPLRLRAPERARAPSARPWLSDLLARLPSGGFSLPAVYLSEPSDVWLRVAMQLVASHMLVNYKGVLGPRSALGPTSDLLRALPCTYDPAHMMRHLQSEADRVPHTFALQLHFEQVGETLFADLYCSTEIHPPNTLERLARALEARLTRVARG